MGLTVKQTGDGSNFKLVPEGLHIGICYAIYDLGTHHDKTYDKDIHKVLICWELPEERMDFEKDGQTVNAPMSISAKYTMSLGQKSTLRKVLETWRSRQFTEEELRGFNLFHVLRAPCQLQVIHAKSQDGTKTYANISGIVQAPKGYKKDPENPVRFFSFEEGFSIPDGTPEWIEKLIKESNEWNDRIVPFESGAEKMKTEDDIPF